VGVQESGALPMVHAFINLLKGTSAARGTNWNILKPMPTCDRSNNGLRQGNVKEVNGKKFAQETAILGRRGLL